VEATRKSPMTYVEVTEQKRLTLHSCGSLLLYATAWENWRTVSLPPSS
jgi:hypothetical protein